MEIFEANFVWGILTSFWVCSFDKIFPPYFNMIDQQCKLRFIFFTRNNFMIISMNELKQVIHY